MAFEFRGSDPSVKIDTRMEAPIYRYKQIQDVPWSTFVQQPDTPVRIIVQSKNNILPLDVLYIPRENKRLLVGLHGAEFGNRDLPKFQFVRSFMASRNESLLFISDSTHLHSPGDIGICWYVGDPAINITIAYANLIILLGRATGIQETVLVGHSAGGMGAIKIGSRIRNSRAIAINAQFSAKNYYPWSLDPLNKFVFPREESPAVMVDKYIDRFELNHSLDTRVENSSVSWFSHINDASSFNEYPNFNRMRDYFALDEGGRTENGDVVVSCNWVSPPNAHALPGTVLPFIAETLGETSSFDLNPCIDIDLKWYR